MNKYFDPEECLIADELWNLLSGQTNTMESILEIINTISTPQFLTKLQYVNNRANRAGQEYRTILTEWNLFSEIELIENETTIIRNIRGNNSLTKLFNKNPFDSKGCYNVNRYRDLVAILD